MNNEYSCVSFDQVGWIHVWQDGNKNFHGNSEGNLEKEAHGCFLKFGRLQPFLNFNDETPDDPVFAICIPQSELIKTDKTGLLQPVEADFINATSTSDCLCAIPPQLGGIGMVSILYGQLETSVASDIFWEPASPRRNIEAARKLGATEMGALLRRNYDAEAQYTRRDLLSPSTDFLLLRQSI